MTKTARLRYTLEFKQEAVRLVEGWQSIATAAAARTLVVVDQTLLNWVKTHRQGRLEGVDSKPKVSAEQMEIARLRAELARVSLSVAMPRRCDAFSQRTKRGSLSTTRRRRGVRALARPFGQRFDR